jgi:hypothetical protein
MIYPKLQVDLHETLDQDDLALYLDHLQVPAYTQTKQTNVMPSGKATWQISKRK